MVSGTCATGCSGGVPGKQAGSSPIVTLARRGLGRDSCPVVCQPRVCAGLPHSPERPLRGVTRRATLTRVVQELKSSDCGALHSLRPAAKWGRSRRPSPGFGTLGHNVATAAGWRSQLLSLFATLSDRMRIHAGTLGTFGGTRPARPSSGVSSGQK